MMHSQAAAGHIELGEVISVADPDNLNRVQVRFLSRGAQSGDSAKDSVPWALVATGFAGSKNGSFLLPDVGSRVVLSCLNGDPRYPVVLGAVWDGSTESPDRLQSDSVDRWTFSGKNGTRIAMIEDEGTKVVLETSSQTRVEIDESNGHIELTQGSNSIKLDSSGIKMTSSATVEIQCSTFNVTGTQGAFDLPLADFSGFIMSELMQTNSVIASAYTPSAGNML